MPATPTLRTAPTPPSTYADHWRTRLEDAPILSAVEIFAVRPGDTVLVAVAHPDDETLAMGAALADLARYGVAVHVVAMCAGEAALDHVGVHVEGLAARRRGELVAATTELGVAAVAALSLPDGRLAEHEAEMEVAVAEAIDATGAIRVATLWSHDPHPDHQAVSRAVAVAARPLGLPVLEFALWTLHWTDPADVPLEPVVVDGGEQPRRAKRAALARYPSQTEPLAEHLDPVLPESVTGWPYEVVLRS